MVGTGAVSRRREREGEGAVLVAALNLSPDSVRCPLWQFLHFFGQDQMRTLKEKSEALHDATLGPSINAVCKMYWLFATISLVHNLQCNLHIGQPLCGHP